MSFQQCHSNNVIPTIIPSVPKLGVFALKRMLMLFFLLPGILLLMSAAQAQSSLPIGAALYKRRQDPFFVVRTLSPSGCLPLRLEALYPGFSRH